jgi:TetR/AcrR family transcriptional regulator, tetracycline repressor protein
MNALARIKQERGLERKQIVRTALMLLDEVGYSGLTLRKLAAKLNVKAAALYWHFENKQDLIDAMAHDIMLDEYVGTKLMFNEWPQLLSDIAHTNRRALLRYRDAAQVLGHANMAQDDMLDGMEFVMRNLKEQGFSDELALQSFFIVIRYTIGCVVEEQTDPRNNGVSGDERKALLRSMANKHPVTAAMFVKAGRAGLMDPERRFDSGLQIIIAGIGHRLDASPKLA